MSRHRELYDCFALARRFPIPTPDEEAELGQRAASGDEGARWALVLGHLRLALRFALHRRSHGRPSAEDLFQDAVTGLCEAARDFDPAQGRRFSTHAGWKIRGAFKAAEPGYLAVYVPCNTLREAKHRVKHETKARRALMASTATDAGADSDPDPASIFGAAPSEPERAERDEERALLHEWVAEFPPLMRDVAVARFGLDGEPKVPIHALARRMGMTKDRVHAMERQARAQLTFLARRNSVAEQFTGATA